MRRKQSRRVENILVVHGGYSESSPQAAKELVFDLEYSAWMRHYAVPKVVTNVLHRRGQGSG